MNFMRSDKMINFVVHIFVPTFFWILILIGITLHTAFAQSRILNIEVLSLGTVANTSMTSLALITPAMEVALFVDIVVEYDMRLNFSLTSLYNTSILDEYEMPDYSDDMLSEWFYQRRTEEYDVTVIVVPGGPEDLSVNRLAMNWNVLFITCGSSRSVLMDKTLSPTWVTTTAFSASQAASVYGNIFRKYNWTSLFVVLDSKSIAVFQSAAETVNEHFGTEPGYQLTYTVTDGLNDTGNQAVLRQFADLGRGRCGSSLPLAVRILEISNGRLEFIICGLSLVFIVLLFFGHAKPFRLFMVQAIGLNMTGREYVYIVLEPYYHNIIGNFTWRNDDADDQIAFRAFQSVILLALDDPAMHHGKEEVLKAPRWRQMSHDEFNYTYEEGEMFVPTVASSHYTMEFLAMVLNESLLIEDFDYQNGTALARLFFNRSFTVDEEDFYIDEFGQRQVKWWSSFFDNSAGSFVRYLVQDENAQELREIKQVVWYGGNELPSNEPKCGFRGLSRTCLLQLDNAWVNGIIVTVCILLIIILIVACWRAHRHEQSNKMWWRLDEVLTPSTATKKTESARWNSGSVRFGVDVKKNNFVLL